jgi:hypothetical protein
MGSARVFEEAVPRGDRICMHVAVDMVIAGEFTLENRRNSVSNRLL